MRRTWSTAATVAALCGAVASSALAQDQDRDQDQTQDTDRPPAADNPLLTDTSADQLLRERLSRPAGGISIVPAQAPGTSQVVPGQPVDASRLDLADGSTAWTEAGTLRPEGTFLVGWVGEVVRLRTGGLAFIPATQEGQVPEPAMALVPTGTYHRIASVVGGQPRGIWLSLTGEVLEYHGRNYLLPTAFAAAAEPETIQDQTEQADDPADDQASDQPAEDQPSGNRIDDLMRDLETERAERRGIDTVFADPAESDGDSTGPRLDGRMLMNQRARMIRSGEGGWVIALDNDRAQPSLELPYRLRLLPCRVVERMEFFAERQGESWDFEISGQLYRQGSTVYLLPRMFVTIQGEDVNPLQ